MILFNEKVDIDDECCDEPSPIDEKRPVTPPPRSRRPSPRQNPSELGLLHRYLDLHLKRGDSTDTSPDEQPEDLGGGRTTLDYRPDLSIPPRSKTPFSLRIDQGQPQETLEANLPPPVASADDVHALYTGDRDINGTWTFAAGANGIAGPSVPIPQPLIDPLSRHWQPRGLKLETSTGKITAQLVMKDRLGGRPRRHIKVTSREGSIDLTLKVDDNNDSAKFHLSAETHGCGGVTIRLPSSFIGLLRIRKPPSPSYEREPSFQFDHQHHPFLQPFHTTVNTIITSIPLRTPYTSTTELFVGDLPSSGYIKGMSDDEWTGNLIEISVERGRVRLITCISTLEVRERMHQALMGWRDRIVGGLVARMPLAWR